MISPETSQHIGNFSRRFLLDAICMNSVSRVNDSCTCLFCKQNLAV